MTDSYVVITGASAGIGRAAALAFANRQKNLVLVARRKAELDSLKAEILLLHPELDVRIYLYDLAITANCYLFYQELASFSIETWINNAGFGNFDSIANQDLTKIETMLRLNIDALTILSSLFVRDYQLVPHTQLINISSSGGYTIVPNAVTYCATKFYVSSFTEGLALELQRTNAPLIAKVLAPSSTETEFAQIANNLDNYDYAQQATQYHTSEQMADFLLTLYDSQQTVGHINRSSYELELTGPKFNYL